MRERKSCKRRFVGTFNYAAESRKGKEFLNARATFNENPSYKETTKERKSCRRSFVGTLDEADESLEGTEFHLRARSV